MTVIKILVDAGKANAGPPIGPALGPLGVDTMGVVNEINNKTKDLEGIKVPVEIIINTNKSFEIVIGMPQTSAFIKKELGIQKATGKVGEDVSGNLSFDQILKITKIKYSSLLAINTKNAVKEILGTCRSMSVNVDGKKVSEIIKDINSGKYDSKL
jgi:large subunit ribosomal protein L11